MTGPGPRPGPPRALRGSSGSFPFPPFPPPRGGGRPPPFGLPPPSAPRAGSSVPALAPWGRSCRRWLSGRRRRHWAPAVSPPVTSRLQLLFLLSSPLPERWALPAGRVVPAACGFPRGHTVSRWGTLPGRARSGPALVAPSLRARQQQWLRGLCLCVPCLTVAQGSAGARRAGPELCEVPESNRLEKTSDIIQSDPCEMMGSFGSVKCGCAGWGIEGIRVER